MNFTRELNLLIGSIVYFLVNDLADDLY